MRSAPEPDELKDRRHRPAIPQTRGSGVAIAAITAVISGVAVFLNAFGVKAWVGAGASSAGYTTAKNLVAAVFLVTVLGVVRRRRSPEGLTMPSRPRHVWGLLAIGVFGGSVPFLLFFEGLARASSTQAAFIHKTLVVWVALLAIPLLRERVGVPHVAAITMLLIGQGALAGRISDYGAGSGELMIAAATLLWAVEVVIAKQLLKEMSAITVGTARMAIGVMILLAYALATGTLGQLAALGVAEWRWAVLGGLILTGYVGTWYLALARAQAVDVTAILVFGAVITSLLQSGPPQTGAGVLGLALVSGGCFVVGRSALRERTLGSSVAHS